MAGSYTVRQVVGTCTTAASVPVVVTKLASCSSPPQARVGLPEKVQLFPNPTTGTATLMFEGLEVGMYPIHLVYPDGKQVLLGMATESELSQGYALALKVPTGIYLLRVANTVLRVGVE